MNIEAIQQLDAGILLWIQENLRCGFLDVVMTIITYLGEFGALWLAVCVALFIYKKTREQAIGVLLSLASEYIINDLLLKRFIARVRPYEAVDGLMRIIAEQGSTSFPSGHSASSFAAATALTILLGKKGAWAFIPATLIALSRMYVGVHYPSDVLAGMLVGVLISLWVCLRWKKVMERREKEAEAARQKAGQQNPTE